jgi:hypothetical protein
MYHVWLYDYCMSTYGEMRRASRGDSGDLPAEHVEPLE